MVQVFNGGCVTPALGSVGVSLRGKEHNNITWLHFCFLAYKQFLSWNQRRPRVGFGGVPSIEPPFFLGGGGPVGGLYRPPLPEVKAHQAWEYTGKGTLFAQQDVTHAFAALPVFTVTALPRM